MCLGGVCHHGIEFIFHLSKNGMGFISCAESFPLYNAFVIKLRFFCFLFMDKLTSAGGAATVGASAGIAVALSVCPSLRGRLDMNRVGRETFSRSNDKVYGCVCGRRGRCEEWETISNLFQAEL